MHAARPSSNGNAFAIRNQLLSGDIGNLDLSNEVPINRPQAQTQTHPHPHLHPQQFQQQAYYPQSAPQNQQFQTQQHQQPSHNPPHQHQHPQQYHVNNKVSQQYYNNQPQYYPQPTNFAPNPVQPPPSTSRRSSLVSTNSKPNNFRKFGNKISKGFGGSGAGGGDEDDDDKDVVIDVSKTELMSFDDLTTMRDRGRYGGQSSYDAAPIIPTLGALPSLKNGVTQGSNTQYRKQMTMMKKQALSHAAKVGGDPRAMSLQYGTNPYANNDPRTRSLTSQPQAFVNGHQGAPNPRQPYQPMVNGPRTNSLTSGANQQIPSSRAYSLTSNPYQPGDPSNQSRQGPNSNRTSQSTGFNNQRQSLQNQRFSNPGPSPLNHQAVASPQHQHSSIPIGGNTQPLLQQSTISHDGAHYISQSTNQNFRQQVAPQLEQISETRVPQQVNKQPNVSIVKENEAPVAESTFEHPKDYTKNREQNVSPSEDESDKDLTDRDNHHYLADNQDRSGFSHSEQLFKDQTLPNEESTPDNSKYDDGNNPDSPSKLPRSKALPHLSLLSLRDDSDEESDEEIVKESDTDDLRQEGQSPHKRTASQVFVPTVLEPLDESKVYEARSITPPNNQNQQQSYFKSPSRTSPFKNDSSPFKNGHNKFSKNSVSISSMSEMSTVSDNPDYVTDNNAKLYQLAHASNTNTDVFVTASQFSLIGGEGPDIRSNGHSKRASQSDRGYQSQSSSSLSQDDTKTPRADRNSSTNYETPRFSNNSTFNDDETPKAAPFSASVKDASTSGPVNTPLGDKRGSFDGASVKSNSGSIKTAFKSPKFLKKWSLKREEKKRINSFEKVIKPAILEPTEVSFDGNVEKLDVHKDKLKNIGNDSQGLKIYGDEDDSYPEISPATSTPPSSTRDENLSIKQREYDLSPTTEETTLSTVKVHESEESYQKGISEADPDVILGESFVPQKTASSNRESFDLTVDQLGIMEDNTTIIRELDLVSKELAASINREILLEEKLNNKNKSELSPSDYSSQLRESAAAISDLTQKLNNERKKRYIAEEFTLLQQHGVKPSLLELNYLNEELKSELGSKDELINNLNTEIDSLRSDIPVLKQKLEELSLTNKNLESEIIPSLKNKIKLLSNDSSRISILAEKVKILNIEKLELEKRLQGFPEELSPTHSEYLTPNKANFNQNTKVGEAAYSSPLASQKQRPFLNRKISANSSAEDLRPPTSPLNSKRLTSLSLLSVSTSNNE